MLTGMCSTTTIWAEETNLITNPDFENGIDGWSMYHHTDADAEIFAQDGTLAMTVWSLGALNYAVQLSGNAVDLVENACYQLEFDISSAQDRYIDAIVQQQGGSYQAYAAQGLNLTADMQHIELVFRMEYASSAATLVFNCGNHNETLSEHTIYLDNVSLIQVDDSALEQYDPYEPPIVVNQVGYTPNARKTAVFRHDNCGCTTIYENGRQRQDVWSKKHWEVPAADAGAKKPTILTPAQGRALQAKHRPTVLTRGRPAVVNQSKAIDLLNDYGIPSDAKITSKWSNVNKVDRKKLRTK